MARASLTIDLGAIIANWRALDAQTNVETAAVIKADAYGLGTARVGAALAQAGARTFFVALAEEGAVLREAIGLFEGKLDFAKLSAKRKSGKPVRTTQRTIFRSEVASREGGFDLVFEGDGFLYKMVRMMVGAAVDCARGRKDVDWIRGMLESPENSENCSACAPADGLYLVEVNYG